MIKVITAPEQPNKRVKIFLAGGISNCSDWQQEAINYLSVMFQRIDLDIVLINPRRYDFDVSKQEMSEEQITWEHKMLEESDYILFWFPKETLCPITLFELGKYCRSNKKLFVGCDPEYQRSFDVKYQLGLVNEATVDSDLYYLCARLRNHVETNS